MARLTTKSKKKDSPVSTARVLSILGAGVCLVLVYLIGFSNWRSVEYDRADAEAKAASSTTPAAAAAAVAAPVLNKTLYNTDMLALAHIPLASTTSDTSTTTPKGMTLIIPGTATTSVTAAKTNWPVATVYPNAGALLPFNRIVAYYGNFYSTGMGVLGEYPPPQMIQMLQGVVAQWTAADPSTPVIPAIDYIAVTAQGSPGADGMYRLRMPDSQIQEALGLANQVHGIVILDVQVGLSTVETEVPLLAQYLAMPNVELALDPEFAMHDGAKPGTEIGSLDASDINWASKYLATLVDQNNLPPKVLIVHRFTEDMVTNAQDIEPLPEVQFVMDMDGWGSQAKKIGTYTNIIDPEPVQFTGFKLFYKNDLKPPSTGMLTPAQVLGLTPAPSFIQYQ